MALKGKALTVCYVAWNGSTNAGQPGDAANHALKLVQDGARGAPINAPAEVDAAGAPGVYTLALTAAEMAYDCVTLCGISSAPNVAIIPLVLVTEQGLIDASISSRASPAQILVTPAYPLATDSTGAAIADVARWSGDDVPAPRVPGVPQVDLEYAAGYAFNSNTGTAQGGTADTITLQSGASTVDGWYVDAFVAILSGTGTGQTPRVITQYAGSALQATVSPPWLIAPDSTSVYEVGGVATAELDLTQPVPVSNLAGTVGDSLNAARAQGFGAWAQVGNVLTIYAPDGSTAIRTFTLDSATAPTSRS